MLEKNNVNNRPKINQKILEIRKGLGITQQEAAAKLGMKYDTYSKKERNGKITFEFAEKFANTFKIDITLITNSLYGAPIPEPDASTPTIEPIKQKSFIFHENTDKLVDTLYGTQPQTQRIVKINPVIDRSNYPTNEFPFVLTTTEKSLIINFHNFSKSQQNEVLDFMNNIKNKRGS